MNLREIKAQKKARQIFVSVLRAVFLIAFSYLVILSQGGQTQNSKPKYNNFYFDRFEKCPQNEN